MNIQATTTALTSSVSSFSSATLNTGNTQEASNGTSSDTLTISAKGLAMFEQNQQASKEALEAINDVSSKDENATLKTVLEGTSSDDEDDDSTTTTNLSGLTDAQIEQKVADGSITQAEANAELATRKNKSDSEEAVSTVASVDIFI